MKKLLTSETIINDVSGKKLIAFTYNEINDNGDLLRSNVKESFVVLDEEINEIITQLENKLNEKLN